MQRREFLATTARGTGDAVRDRLRVRRSERRLLYVAEPGIRNYVEYGGIGVLVYDIDKGYEFVRRIPTFTPAEGRPPENVKGIAASARTGRFYVSTIGRLGCIDLATDRLLWQKELEGGCDRLAISPDGALLYVPSFEGPHWNVVDADERRAPGQGGDEFRRAQHCLCARRQSRLPCRPALARALNRRPENSYRRRTRWPLLELDPSVHRERANRRCAMSTSTSCSGSRSVTSGPARSCTASRCRATRRGRSSGTGVPSHGIGLTPDEREIWLCDGHNNAVHVFDNTVMPPKQIATIPVRDQPGWISFSIDGAHAYPSTGEVFDTQNEETDRCAAGRGEAGRRQRETARE